VRVGLDVAMKKNDLVRFEVFTAVTMKNAVFWDMAQIVATCSS
jgi:hypothetical protein